MIIQHIDIFNEEEIKQIYLIIHQTDIEKLKELFLYQNSQTKTLLDRIIQLAQEISHIEKHIENETQTLQQQEVEEYMEQNLELNYIMS